MDAQTWVLIASATAALALIVNMCRKAFWSKQDTGVIKLPPKQHGAAPQAQEDSKSVHDVLEKAQSEQDRSPAPTDDDVEHYLRELRERDAARKRRVEIGKKPPPR